MDSDTYLVFDVGGTNLRCGLYAADSGHLLATAFGETASRWAAGADHPDDLLRQLPHDMARLAGRLPHAPRTTVLAVAMPGPVDSQGRVLALPTILGNAPQRPVAVRELFARVWPGRQIVVLNDVTAAALAVLNDAETEACVVTVSSGMGAKLVVDGRVVTGPGGRGGEIGHLVVDRDPDANLCECGGRGHLGAIASGRGVVVSARRLIERDPAGFRRSALGGFSPRELDTAHLTKAFHAGDAWATALIRQAIEALAAVLAGVHATTGIERFVLVGGFAHALGPRLPQMVAAAAAGNCWDLGQVWSDMIELRDLDGLAGLRGAGRYARTVLTGNVK